MSPKDNNKQVSAAVRILHQKRDASARATHLKAGNWIVQFSTIERKKMSTKTSFKRIALVAASALAIAGFSAVPANAAATNTFSTATVTAGTAVTGSAVVGSYVPVTLTFITEALPVVSLTSTGAGTLAVPAIAPAAATVATTTQPYQNTIQTAAAAATEIAAKVAADGYKAPPPS